MLKYQINTRNLYSDITELSIENYKLYEYNFNMDRMSVELYYNTQNNIKVNDKINIFIELTPNDYYDIPEYYDEDFTVEDVDLTRNVIVLNTPRYIKLKISSIEEKTIEEKIWWYFSFKEKHNFYNENATNIKICFDYYENGIYKQHIINNCEFVDDLTLRYCYDDDADKLVSDIIFNGNNIADQSMLGAVKREHYLITNKEKSKFYFKQYNLGVSIPLLNTHDISITKQYNIDEKFVDYENSKVINKPIEMEKNKFIPVCKFWGGDNRVNGEQTKLINKINFNLHLRQRHGKDWQTNNEDFWNGVVLRNDVLELDKKYFATQYKSNTSFQSDLLSKLGFNDADVKYQKSRLKKSFLRLSFYDSPNPGSQNLLAYSTIFLDTNKLSGNMIKNAHQTKYKLYDQITEKEYLNLTGIRTNREIAFSEANGIDVNINNCEDYRLSSRFTVADKNHTNNSSEGFYLYLWKDLTEGSIPVDLYLKVEFNHAGYGRTIPLMFPYFSDTIDDDWDGEIDGSWVVRRDPIVDNNNLKEGENEENGNTFGIKSFNDILNDWNNGGYNIQKYLKYSYIHLKCQFDSDMNQYVYYLDNSFYENCFKIFDQKTNTLNISLYEGKVTDTSVDGVNVVESKYSVTLHTIYNESSTPSDTSDDKYDFQLEIKDNDTQLYLIDFSKFQTNIYKCDKYGYLYDENAENITDLNNIKHDKNNIYYYVVDNQIISCDKDGYVIKTVGGKPLKTVNFKGEMQEPEYDESTDFYMYDGEYCSFNGYILDVSQEQKPYKNNDTPMQYGKENKYYYNDKECDLNGNFYLLDKGEKQIITTYGKEEPLHVYWDEESKQYFCKTEYIKDESGKKLYERNYDKIFMINKNPFNTENSVYIKYKISYNLYNKKGLWDNYVTKSIPTNTTDVLYDIKYGQKDGCSLVLNYVDNLKNNIDTFMIPSITNKLYKQITEEYGTLQVVNFVVDVDCFFDKKYSITSLEKPIRVNIGTSIGDNRLRLSFKQTEFIFNKIPTYTDTDILFSVYDSNNQLVENETDLQYDIKLCGLADELFNDEFYLTDINQVFRICNIVSTTGHLTYNKKLRLTWNSIETSSWQHWKFVQIEVSIKDKNTDDIKGKETIYFTLLEPNHKEDMCYLINNNGVYATEKKIEGVIIYNDALVYDYRFNAYIIPLYISNKINYYCNKSYPVPNDFEVKFIGVKDYDNVIMNKRENGDNDYKIVFTPYDKTLTFNPVTNVEHEISLWVKSQKFPTLEQTIKQKIKYPNK